MICCLRKQFKSPRVNNHKGPMRLLKSEGCQNPSHCLQNKCVHVRTHTCSYIRMKESTTLPDKGRYSGTRHDTGSHEDTVPCEISQLRRTLVADRATYLSPERGRVQSEKQMGLVLCCSRLRCQHPARKLVQLPVASLLSDSH